MTLALIDYGAGNLHSVENALRAAGATDVVVTADPDVAYNADRIVLPGVGAFGACMQALTDIRGMADALENAVLGKGRPFLGICVGMQLMAEYGEEHGRHDGLSWVSGTVKPMHATPEIRIPHMGWNSVQLVNGGHPLLREGEAYFLHSYAYHDAQIPPTVCAITDHGGPVTAAIEAGTAIGVQFHPEKSQAYGLAFLKRFLDWRP